MKRNNWYIKHPGSVGGGGGGTEAYVYLWLQFVEDSLAMPRFSRTISQSTRSREFMQEASSIPAFSLPVDGGQLVAVEIKGRLQRERERQTEWGDKRNSSNPLLRVLKFSSIPLPSCADAKIQDPIFGVRRGGKGHWRIWADANILTGRELGC